MKVANLLAAATLAALVSPLSAGVASAQPGAPINVTSCGIDGQPFAPLQPIEDVRLASGVRISFVNTASVAATSIEFAVRYGETTQRVVAEGPFAAGSASSQNLGIAPSLPGDGTAQCDVVGVTFADGSAWPGTN
jgi:hypothetical protein